MISYKFLITLFFTFFVNIAFSQTQASGYIYDAESLEPLIDARISIKDGEDLAYTDHNGHYHFNHKATIDSIIVYYIGYEEKILAAANLSDVYLTSSELEEIVVSAKQEKRTFEIGKIRLNTNQILSIPTIGGEPDIFKSIALLPGITNTTEGSAGYIVRGGAMGHNLVRLDGVTMYNNSHYFGYLSTYNPSAIKTVHLYKSGFPSLFTGKLASVLDLYAKDGNKKKTEGNFRIGLVNSSVLLEGPLIKDKLSYLIAARGMNFAPFFMILKRFDQGGSFGYWVYDTNVKLSYFINDNQKITTSFFNTRDDLHIFNDTPMEKEDVKVNWGSTTLSTIYSNTQYKNLKLNTGIYLNYYPLSRRLRAKYPEENQEVTFTNKSKIRELRWSTDNHYYLGYNTKLNFGIDQSFTDLKPFKINQTYTSDTDIKNYITGDSINYKTRREGAYLELNHDFSKKIKTTIGGRYDHYTNGQYRKGKFSTRVNLAYHPTERQEIKLAYDEMFQPLHQVSSIEGGTQTELFIPSTDELPASSSKQLSLGYSYGTDKYLFLFETFYKKVDNQVRTNNNKYFYFIRDRYDASFFNPRGKGIAYGIETMFKTNYKAVDLTIGYTWTRSLSRYATVNNNKYFNTDFVKNHEVNVVGSYKFNKKWSVFGNFVYQTGRPITLPDALIKDVSGGYTPKYSGINKHRTQPYHRLDISFVYSKYRENGTKKSELSFGLYNVYFNRNPYYYSSFYGPDKDGNNYYRIKAKSLLNTIPSLSYTRFF